MGLSGTILALKLIRQLLLPAEWWQLWLSYTLAILLPLGQVSWTDLSLVFPWFQAFREDFQWEVVSKLNYSASGLIHVQMDWLSNVRETRDRADIRAFFTALKALYLISVLSKGSIAPRAVIEGLNYLRKSHYPQLAVSKHPRRGVRVGAGACRMAGIRSWERADFLPLGIA